MEFHSVSLSNLKQILPRRHVRRLLVRQFQRKLRISNKEEKWSSVLTNAWETEDMDFCPASAPKRCIILRKSLYFKSILLPIYCSKGNGLSDLQHSIQTKRHNSMWSLCLFLVAWICLLYTLYPIILPQTLCPYYQATRVYSIRTTRRILKKVVKKLSWGNLENRQLLPLLHSDLNDVSITPQLTEEVEKTELAWCLQRTSFRGEID